MITVKPSFSIETKQNGTEILKQLEKIGRTCYKSENLINEESAEKFIKNIIMKGHEAIIEHYSVTVRIICDRGVSHEIVRHRIASYAQESTRYCNYSKDKFSNQLTFVEPSFWDISTESGRKRMEIWQSVMKYIEDKYMELIESGAAPQEARSILPNSLKTEIVVTMNLREWRHFFKLRTANDAHPQIREIAIPLLDEFKRRIPIIFDDISIES